MKKAIVIPYADARACEWAQDVFPLMSIASLPVCGKPIIAHELDELSRQGVSEVLVLDGHFDRRLVPYLSEGGKWGMKVHYAGSEESGDEAVIRRRNAAFIGDDELVLVRDNVVSGIRIDSLRAYYDVNMLLLEKPNGCVIPGYLVEPATFVGSDVVIRPGAEVKGPVCLCNGVRLERGVQIQPKSILGGGCVIDRGARISESIVLRGTYVGKHVELVRKIAAGGRVIDPFTGVYVDIAGDGIAEAVESGSFTLPATDAELAARRYTGAGDAATEASLAVALAEIGRDIAALGLPKLEGVYLGGGYGRGEGGAPLYNDLDFFPLVGDVTEEERSEIQVALDALAMGYACRLGVHVDFCRPKTRADFLRDERRIMVQEFLRGNVPVYGRAEALSFLKEYPAADLPASEALRTLVNRGMGLYLARESDDPSFVCRNINKAVLGAGDAMLTAERRYDWSVTARAKALGSPEYARAVELKFRPTCEMTCTWERARELWLEAAVRIRDVRGSEIARRSLRQGIRYVRRRRRFGSVFDFGLDPLLRILRPLELAIGEGTGIDPETMKDWETFN